MQPGEAESSETERSFFEGLNMDAKELRDCKDAVELKACEILGPVHRARLVCYLHLMKLRVGLLVNFNVAILVDGLKRVVIPKQM